MKTVYHRFRFLILVLLSFLMAACATAPGNQNPESEKIATAKRFLHSWDAGGIAMAAFRQKLESESMGQPGMGELMRRVFADFKGEEFEDLAAPIYAHHLTQAHLTELARFTDSKTGNRFFRLIIKSAAEGKPNTQNDVMRQFNADELTEIVKFAQSDAFVALTRELPAINRELGEAGRQFGEAKMREYLKRH